MNAHVDHIHTYGALHHKQSQNNQDINRTIPLNHTLVAIQAYCTLVNLQMD